MCTAAYREALTREFSSKAPSAGVPASVPARVPASVPVPVPAAVPVPVPAAVPVPVPVPAAVPVPVPSAVPVPAPAAAPGRCHATEAGREDVAGRPLWPGANPGQHDLESCGVAGAGATGGAAAVEDAGAGATAGAVAESGPAMTLAKNATVVSGMNGGG
ncbi:MAG: hypothetical protein ACLPQY_11155 [Streptosporangiaceae bacterium]